MSIRAGSATAVEELFGPMIGAYSPRTIKGYSSDFLVFRRWCQENDCSSLPAEASTLAAFVDDQVRTQCISTIKRRRRGPIKLTESLLSADFVDKVGK
jgi:hypothetical protein